MAKKVIMPKFGMDQEVGTISAWLKQAGDTVEKGEPILEVETDKINMEVEANASGILAGIRFGPGETAPIGEVIAYILMPGESLPAELSPQTQKAGEAAPPVRASPLAERIASTHGVDLQAVAAGKTGGRIVRADVEARLGHQLDNGDKIRAVPAARRLARELNVDLVAVAGSGPAGRIQSSDVRQAAAANSSPAASVESPATPTVRRQIPLSAMRRAIADRLTASVRDVPQFTVGMEIEMSRALEMVADLRTAAEIRVTLTAFLIKACAWTLARHPHVNASFNPQGISEWPDINIGLAVSVEGGLLVPVVHHADRLSMLEIAVQLADVGQRAREGKLQLGEMQGGTFTISNLGMLGVDHFTAIINPPQAAILAVSRAAKRPVVTPNNQIEIKLLADFTLTADHRLLDGASAAQFLADLKKAIEHPGLLL